MKLATLFLSVVCVLAANASVAQSRYSYSPDGSEVNDSQTGLIWRRCAEGMAWNGTTCTGTSILYTHELALAHAKNQTGWRLPNIKELSSILDFTHVTPLIDQVAFPAFRFYIYWSSTPSAIYPDLAWSVSFVDGTTRDQYRVKSYSVRLVR